MMAEIEVRRDPVDYAKGLGARIGEGTRIYTQELDLFGDCPFLVKLGQNCHVTYGVRFITHDGGVLLFRDKYPDADLVAPIVIGDNVYIGMRTTILPGVHVGNNVIIGAGAVVTRSIPGNSIVAGIPAKVIRSLGEYEAKVREKSVHTGKMTLAEKTPILKSLFERELGE
jgi:tetrahydrodipicolinate N-succinyltransferase